MKTYLDHKVESQDGLFKIVFEDGYVVWRPLTWGRYKRYREASAILQDAIYLAVEEAVYDECVIDSSFEEPPPEDLSEEEKAEWVRAVRAEMPAGVISTTVKMILRISGGINGDMIMEQLSEQRALVHNIEDQLTVVICRAFPAYTPEMLEALPWSVVLKRAAQAEMILGTTLELDRPEPVRPARFDVTEDMKKISQEFSGRPSPQGESQADPRAEQRRLKDEYLRRREAMLGH